MRIRNECKSEKCKTAAGCGFEKLEAGQKQKRTFDNGGNGRFSLSHGTGAVNFGLHVQLGVSLPGNVRSVSVEKHLSAPFGAVRGALPPFVARNDLSSLMQQGLTLAKILPLALNCVALILPRGKPPWAYRYYWRK